MNIPPKVTEKLMDYIEKVYPGGMETFVQKGGDLFYLPESIIISFPEENLKLKRDIGTQFYGTPFLFFTNPFNTDQGIFADIQNELIRLFMEDEAGAQYSQSISISVRSCYILIQAMVKLPKQMVQKLRKMVDEFEVPRVLFFQPGESIEIWQTVETKPEDKSVSIEKKPHSGGTVISTEQITDLRIDLNQEEDVNDFLKRLEG